MEPLEETVTLCDCCFRCVVHCICVDGCEPEYTEARIGEECPICAVEDKE